MKYELLSGKIDQQRAQTIGRMLFNRYDLDRKGTLDKNQCYSIFSDYCYRILVIHVFNFRISRTHQIMKMLNQCRVYWITTETKEYRSKTSKGWLWNISVHSINSRRRCRLLSWKSIDLALSRPKKYTRIVRERLAVAQRLFKMFDKDNSGFITEEEVPGILIETYKELGQKFVPTKSDVRSWVIHV